MIVPPLLLLLLLLQLLLYHYCCYFYYYYHYNFIIIIIIIFMMCRFYECAGFMWCSWHASVVWLLLETCAKILTILPTSSKHVSVGMPFLVLGIGGLSHQSCMSLRIGTNNIVGGSITTTTDECTQWRLHIGLQQQLHTATAYANYQHITTLYRS